MICQKEKNQRSNGKGAFCTQGTFPNFLIFFIKFSTLIRSTIFGCLVAGKKRNLSDIYVILSGTESHIDSK